MKCERLGLFSPKAGRPAGEKGMYALARAVEESMNFITGSIN
jgi:hypothetical protein